MKTRRHIVTDTRRAAYRIREVAQMTGIPASTIRARIRSGDINPITSLGVWLISADDLEAILSKRLRNQP